MVSTSHQESLPVDDGSGASSSQDSSVAPSAPSCQFDRYWLQKLVLKHAGRPIPRDVEELKEVKIYASAPMVDQSDLPYRLQCRRYGTNICFTPMIHAKQFMTSAAYRKKFKLTNSPETDRPLIAQLCGGTDPETMLQCALQLQDYCDGIDINCGCPQGIARRGNYGAFLLEKEETLLTLVKYLVPRLKVPLSVKVRLLPEEDVTKRLTLSLALYRKLVDAGIHLLTIHGRTRHQKANMTGPADWSAIASAVEQLGDKIPILANGSIGSAQDVMECLQKTNVDGVMSSEAILEYPPLFQPLTLQGDLDIKPMPRVGRVHLAREYLELAREYPPDRGGQGNGLKCIRVHMHRFLHGDLQVHTSVRDLVVRSKSLEDLEAALDALDKIHQEENHSVEDERMAWYMRYRNPKKTEEKNKNDSTMQEASPPSKEQ